MKIKLSILFSFLMLIFVSILSPRNVYAASFQLSGNVQYSSGGSVSGATVDVIDTTTNANIAKVTTDSSGNYITIISGGTYDVMLTPPAGSTYTSAIAPSTQIIANTVINFILVPSGTINLSGHIYDPLGNPLSNQTVALSLGSIYITANTDNNGYYSMQASPATYKQLDISNSGTSLSQNVPESYDLRANNFSLTQSTVLNITVPANKVTVHVQDISNNAVSNATLLTNPVSFVNQTGLNIGGGITNAEAMATYGQSQPYPTTDTSGNVTLWLLPNDANHSYSIAVSPPSGTIF